MKLLATLSLLGAAFATTLAAPVALADTGGSSLLVRNATVYTMTRDAAAALNGTDVLVQDGRVTAIGTALAAPAGTRVIEANGRALTPGIFGGLGHIGLEEIGLEQSTGDYAQRLGQMRPEFDVTLAFNPESMSLVVHRSNGITFSVLAPAAARGGSLVAGLGAPTGLDGSAPAPARAMFVDLGGDANDLSGGSRAAQFMLLRQALVEARAPNLVMVHDERLLSPSGRQVLLEFLKGNGLFVLQVDRAIDIRNALAFAREEKLNVAIRGGAEAWRVATELAAARVPVILDPLDNLPDSFDKVGATLTNAARLRAAGVTVAVSINDTDVDDAGKTRQAAGNAVAHGMPKWDALAAVTRVPAEIFGIADRFGSIERGRTADLVLWSGDPLEVSSLPDLVVTGGRVQTLESRHTALRDRHYERVKAGMAR
ncbi:MAG: amidohydrolase family protein [Gammaproteobacteria bacterium]|nr:amidohydrolase family protein [Gammaproteobacteria bacterium]MBM4209339.1 amidohydrolase family protein [Gammaproteobacteria bacterium]MBM4224214.1 amidohydrolase family protein [Gammaproteobacteria bacterium]MBM4230618.1 amidohydrolase family protein [Gammaproteobacteria bacterium]